LADFYGIEAGEFADLADRNFFALFDKAVL